MARPAPRVGVPLLEPSGWPGRVRAAGAEPVPLRLPTARPGGGVALAREWVADTAEVLCAQAGPDGLLLQADAPEDLFGLLLAAARLSLPTVCAAPPGSPLSAVVAALGLAPVAEDPANVAAELAAGGGPRAPDLLDNFSLANGLRSGVAAGGGPEVVVHLSALARESGVAGFAQMARVLAPETAARPAAWVEERGVPALLASLGGALHEVPTVCGGLKDVLPEGVVAPEPAHRFVVLRARRSGAEALCVAPPDLPETVGACRVFGSEGEAVRAVEGGAVGDGSVLVVAGCGPRGGPGLLRLDALAGALGRRDLRAPVLTDGLAPSETPGVWASLFTPEAAVGGVIRRLRDGDVLRLDLEAGRLRTEVDAKEFRSRGPREAPAHTGPGYAARYARSALPAPEGAGLG